jgi:hypothetical protein
MSLENLVGRSLERHECTRDEVARLLAAARRNLRDAGIKENSTETRFDVAYKAVMQCTLVALMANGFRPLTSAPGHHATVIQSLPQTIGLTADRRVVLDKLRRMRNVADYSGEDISEEEAAACLRAARALLDDVSAWLKKHRSELT